MATTLDGSAAGAGVGDADGVATTEHAVTRADGTAGRVAVDHAFYEATQFDLYVPTAIWEHPAVRAFFRRIDAVEASATLFPGATGVWLGRPEGTTVYRKILRGNPASLDPTRQRLRVEVGRLMAELSLSPAHAQQAVLFTETAVRVSMSDNLRATPDAAR
jgi:hypothetical protein